MEVEFKYEDGSIKNLEDFKSYEEYKDSEWASPVDVVLPPEEDTYWAGENELRELVFNNPKLYWDCNVGYVEQDEITQLLDWCDVEGIQSAKYFSPDKVYGKYGSWWTFVESMGEMYQEDFEAELSEEQKHTLNCSYNFDWDRFERNLDMDFIMGKYGTVFYRN